MPVGVIGGPVQKLTNPDFNTMAIYRGWVADDPMSVIVSSRRRKGATLRRLCRQLGADFHATPGDGDAITVCGAHGARRIEGLLDLEEGLGEPPQWTERVTVIVAAARHEFVTLTVRRRPEDDLDDAVERVVASFELRQT